MKGAWNNQENILFRDGVTYTYCQTEHVRSETDRLLENNSGYIDDDVSDEVRATWLNHCFTQIHPYWDGNGPVVCALASLVPNKDASFP